MSSSKFSHQFSSNALDLLPAISGVLLIGVFSLNAYIGMKDIGLSQLQPVHEAGNFLLALLDLAAAAILLAYGTGRVRWLFLSGIAFPAAYILSLVADVESRMCLFTGTNCFKTVNLSYRYLILGDASQGWELWKYTIPTAISLLLVAMCLTSVYCVLSMGKNRSPEVKTNQTTG